MNVTQEDIPSTLKSALTEFFETHCQTAISLYEQPGLWICGWNEHAKDADLYIFLDSKEDKDDKEDKEASLLLVSYLPAMSAPNHLPISTNTKMLGIDELSQFCEHLQAQTGLPTQLIKIHPAWRKASR